MSIKCPHCGSSAQVKTEPSAKVSDDQKWLVLACECGCGCKFNASYHTARPIVKWINIEHMERKEDK